MRLLLIPRYREELHRHADRHQAMAVGLRRAGPAVVVSAAAVATGLLCLFAAQLNSNRASDRSPPAIVLAALTIGIGGMPIGLTAAQTYTTKPASVAGQELLAAHFPAGSAEPAQVICTASGAGQVAAAAALFARWRR